MPAVRLGIHADISRSEYSTGTGIVLTADGYIVTNTHVLDGAKAVTVTTSDGTEYTGKLVGADAVSDIAVLKIEAQGLTPAEFATPAPCRSVTTSCPSVTRSANSCAGR